MRRSVSNALPNWALTTLAGCGIDTAAILDKCQISSYELSKSNGRIPDTAYYQLLLQTMQYKQLLRQNVSTELFFSLFPDLFGLCLNESSASRALQAFVQYRFLMGNCDDCFIKQQDNQIKIEYQSSSPMQTGNCSVGHFILSKELLSHYLPASSIQVGFDCSSPLAKKEVNDALQTNCLFEQNSNYMIIKDPQLMACNEVFNVRLNALQRARLEASRGDLLTVSNFSTLVAEVIESVISQNNYGSENTILDALCFNLKISRWTLNNKLQLEKTSFTDILKNVRLKKASKLLLETNKSIREISELTCFSSQAVFSRFFRSHANISPIQYRKKFNKNM